MYILSKHFIDKFIELYLKSIDDNGIENDDYDVFFKVCEDYMKNKKTKMKIL